MEQSNLYIGEPKITMNPFGIPENFIGNYNDRVFKNTTVVTEKAANSQIYKTESICDKVTFDACEPDRIEMTGIVEELSSVFGNENVRTLFAVETSLIGIDPVYLIRYSSNFWSGMEEQLITGSNIVFKDSYNNLISSDEDLAVHLIVPDMNECFKNEHFIDELIDFESTLLIIPDCNNIKKHSVCKKHCQHCSNKIKYIGVCAIDLLGLKLRNHFIRISTELYNDNNVSNYSYKKIIPHPIRTAQNRFINTIQDT